jgi:hypothetical protein
MTTINQQREAVKKIKMHPGWAARVDKMPDSQVIAIYIRLKSEGKL